MQGYRALPQLGVGVGGERVLLEAGGGKAKEHLGGEMGRCRRGMET